MNEERIYISISVSSTLSLLGCVFIIVVYFRHTELQGFAYKLIAYLALLDLLHCLLFLIPTYDLESTDGLCICQAFLITIVTLESVIWTSVISISLYFSVVRKVDVKGFVNKIFFYVTAFCSVVSFIPMSKGADEYASRLGWCWLKNDLYKIILLYVPLWLIIILNSIIYMIVIRKVKSEFEVYKEINSLGKSIIRKLRMYPILLIVSFTPVTILRIFETINQSHSENLVIISGIFTCLNGFLNAMVYGCTRQVRELVFTSQAPRIVNYSVFSEASRNISLYTQ